MLLLILSICTLTHEFGYAAHLRRSAISLDVLKNDWIEISKASDILKEVKSLQQRLHDRQKRAVSAGVLLMGTSLTLSYANVILETYLAIEGCCGLYKEACENKEKFDNLKPVVEEKINTVNSEYLAATNALEYVKQCNSLNQEIWVQLNMIKTLSEVLITSIDDSLITKFNTINNEIKEQVMANNQTVIGFTYEQLDIKYNSLYDSTLGRLSMLSKVLGWPLYFAGAYAYKQYKVNQIEKTLTTEFGRQLTNAQPKSKKLFGITDSAVKKHLHQTAVSQYNSKMATSKTTQFINAASHVYYTFSIGFDTYFMIKKIKNCQKIRDETRAGLDKIVEADEELDALLKNVTDYRNFVDKEGWTYVKDQITGDNVTAILEDISSLAKKAGENSKTQELTNASKTIDHFISAVPDADYQTTHQLQGQLVSALDLIVLTFGCQGEMTQLLNYVTFGCKSGHDSIHNLYTAGLTHYKKVNSDSCTDKGTPHVTETDVSNLVKVQAAEEGFQFDCVLNDDKLKQFACDSHYQQQSAAQIASKLGLTEAQVNFFTNGCPLPKSLTTAQKDFVCISRQAGSSDGEIAQDMGFPELEQLVAAYTCPVTALPLDEQKKVCSLRKYMSDEDIAETMDYNLALVKIVVCQ